jgi:hypothetical protein
MLKRRRRGRDERSTVVADAVGERDRADATRSSEREKKIRTDARNSAMYLQFLNI